VQLPRDHVHPEGLVDRSEYASIVSGERCVRAMASSYGRLSMWVRPKSTTAKVTVEIVDVPLGEVAIDDRHGKSVRTDGGQRGPRRSRGLRSRLCQARLRCGEVAQAGGPVDVGVHARGRVLCSPAWPLAELLVQTPLCYVQASQVLTSRSPMVAGTTQPAAERCRSTVCS